jgi:hypothetical protein
MGLVMLLPPRLLVAVFGALFGKRGDPGGLPHVPCEDDILIIILCGLILRDPS